MTEQTANKLIHETSPYLRQHATNPVNWQPWGEPAFQEARERDVPVFLSIGYATCHWCHVMERESFEDPDVAKVLNNRFVSIKVDREERPDIDGQYMKVCQLMTGSGGWPLTVVMTPDKVPFFAATYIPKTSRYGRSGLMELLPRISDLWRDNRETLLQSTGRLMDALKREIASNGHTPIDKTILDSGFQQLDRLFDPIHGGFGESPKFPTPHNLNFLLRYSIQFNVTQARDMVQRTLDMMALGGIHDHVAGGFHRYSTDRQWQVPHFEKMLYDQALMIMPYLNAFRLTGQKRYLRVVKRTVQYVRESLTNKDGCFMSAQDADSEGEEGVFYVWSVHEIREVLGTDMSFLTSLYPLNEHGNYRDPIHGNRSRNILYIDEGALKQTLETSTADSLFEQLDAVLDRLKTVRDKRPHPEVDDKIQTDWNGMMITALASIFMVTGDHQALIMAERAMNGILSHEDRLGTLPHICRKELPVIPGFLDDYAWLIQALLNLYQADYHPHWLEQADRLGRTLLEQFEHPQKGFSFTGEHHEKLLFDQRDSFDGAIPSGSAVALGAVNRLARLTGDPLWTDVADRMERVYATNIQEHPTGHSAMLTALMNRMVNSPTLVVTCTDSATAQEALRPLRKGFYPDLEILVRTPQSAGLLDRLAPHTRQMIVSDEPRFYLCTGQSCRPLISDIREVMTVLNHETGDL